MRQQHRRALIYPNISKDILFVNRFPKLFFDFPKETPSRPLLPIPSAANPPTPARPSNNRTPRPYVAWIPGRVRGAYVLTLTGRFVRRAPLDFDINIWGGSRPGLRPPVRRVFLGPSTRPSPGAAVAVYGNREDGAGLLWRLAARVRNGGKLK